MASVDRHRHSSPPRLPTYDPPPPPPPPHPPLAESEEGPVSDAERERRIALFTPTLERLVALIRGRVRFHEAFDSWHRDERQDFKRARWGGCGGSVCRAGPVRAGCLEQHAFTVACAILTSCTHVQRAAR